MHLAIVHGAIYDAVNAIDGGYEPYLGSPSASSSYSEDAAAATAAYRMLQFLLPSDRDDELLGYHQASLAAILGAGVAPADVNGGVAVGSGVGVGVSVGVGISSFSADSVGEGTGVGVWVRSAN